MSLSPSDPHTTTTDGIGRRSPRTEHGGARRLSPRLISDGVIASYLHDISQRRRRTVPEPKNHLLRRTPDR
jgi:hypothetical protein